MKKLFFLALLCAISYCTQAQDITNSTSCTLNVRSICFNPATCAVVTVVSSVTLGPGNSTPMPFFTCSVLGTERGYIVSQTPLGCNPIELTIGHPGNPPTSCTMWSPAPASIPTSPSCPGCTATTINAQHTALGLNIN